MRAVFADTSFWIAIFDRNDYLCASADAALRGLKGRPLVTTDLILCEFLDAFSRSRSDVRHGAVQMAKGLLGDPHTTCVCPGRDLLVVAMDLYQQRLDKTYGVTDCVSMVVMRQQGLTEILSSDRHFAQEGFRVLLPIA